MLDFNSNPEIFDYDLMHVPNGKYVSFQFHLFQCNAPRHAIQLAPLTEGGIGAWKGQIVSVQICIEFADSENNIAN